VSFFLTPHPPIFAMKSRVVRFLLTVLTPILLCVVTVTTLPAQKLYFAQRGQGGLWQLNVDGTNLSRIIPSNASRYFDFYDVAVDHEGASVYLANGLEGTVVRAGLNGENPTTIVPGTRFRSAIAVDPVHGKLYFENRTDCFCTAIANIDGSDIRDIIPNTPRDLAVDPDAGFLFYTSAGIRRTDLNGQNEVVVHPPGANAIALDPIAQKIYWSDGSVTPRGPGDPDPVPGHIYRANYDGSSVETLIDRINASEIAVDPIRGMIYWYNPINLHFVSATTDGVFVSGDLLDDEIPLVEGLAIDYIIPEPSTAVLTLAAVTLASLAAFRRRFRSASSTQI
jgi:hypothetical protein